MKSDTTLCFIRFWAVYSPKLAYLSIKPPHLGGSDDAGLPHSPWHLAKYLLYSLQKAWSSPSLLAQGGNEVPKVRGLWLMVSTQQTSVKPPTKFNQMILIYTYSMYPPSFFFMYWWLNTIYIVDWLIGFQQSPIFCWSKSMFSCVQISGAGLKQTLAHCLCQCKLERNIPWNPTFFHHRF